jgi:hypothetical protein
MYFYLKKMSTQVSWVLSDRVQPMREVKPVDGTKESTSMECLKGEKQGIRPISRRYGGFPR